MSYMPHKQIELSCAPMLQIPGPFFFCAALEKSPGRVGCLPYAPPPPPCRKFRQNVFSASDWKNHRSVGRYLRHLGSMPSSRILRGLIAPTLTILWCVPIMIPRYM